MSISILRSFPVRNGWILLNVNRIQLPSTAVVGAPVACKLKLSNNTRVVSTANPTNSAHFVAFENHQNVIPPIPFYDEGERFVFNCPRVREVPDEDEVQRIEDVDLYMITGKESEAKLKKRLKFEAYYRKCHPSVQAKLEPLKELFINLTTKSCRPRLLDFGLCHELFSRMGDVTDEETAVIVLYPGPGIITSELVKLGAKHVYAFEPIRGFYDHLKNLHANDLVTVHNRELVTIEDYIGRKMNGPFNHILNQEKIKNIKIITSSGQRNTIKSTLISMLPCITPSSKNIEIYTMAPSLIAKEILGQEKDVMRSMYRSIWNIFMEDELCYKMSVGTFYPPIKKTMVNHKNPHVCVIRSTVKRLPYKVRQFQESDGLYLIAFTSQFKATSSSSVVGTLEKWAPGIGALLIKKGIRVFTPFNQLTTEQYMNVFFTFLDYTTNESGVWDVLSMQKDIVMTEIDSKVEGINNMLYHSN